MTHLTTGRYDHRRPRPTRDRAAYIFALTITATLGVFIGTIFTAIIIGALS